MNFFLPNFCFNSDGWTQDEMDTLYWYYVQSKKSKDVVGKIIIQIKDSGRVTKSCIAVIQQLLQQDIVTADEYDFLMKFENSQYEREVNGLKANDDEAENAYSSSQSNGQKQPDDIRVSYLFNKVNYLLIINN